MIKKTIGILCLLGCCLTAIAQNAPGQVREAQSYSARFMQKADMESEDITASVATVNASMIDALKKKEKDTALLAFLNELHFLRVITVKTSTEQMQHYWNKALEVLKQTGTYEELLNIQQQQQRVIIAAINKTNTNKAQEIVLISCDNKGLSIVDLLGNISIGTLGELSDAVQKAMQNLKK